MPSRLWAIHSTQNRIVAAQSLHRFLSSIYVIMDLFHDSDDDGDTDDIEDASSLSNMAYLDLMVCKPFLRKTVGEISQTFTRKLALVGKNLPTLLLMDKLKKTQFKDIQIISDNVEEVVNFLDHPLFDIIVNLDTDVDKDYHMLLVPGGTYMTLVATADFDSSFSCTNWNISKATRRPSPLRINCLPDQEYVVLQKRALTINPLGAIYWTDNRNNSACRIGGRKVRSNIGGSKGNVAKTSGTTLIDREYSNLEEVSVMLSVAEREQRAFSDASHGKALGALQKHGICIIPGLFAASTVMEWGDAAVYDMTQALITLRKRGIDLLKPSDGDPRIENFHELSMREALRCDIRNGSHMRELSRRTILDTTSVIIEDNDVTVMSSGDSQSSGPKESIRHHPALLSVLQEVLNPPPDDPRDQLGNWGLWNFEGKGPEAGPPPFTIGEVGAVMSLPGCADQTIHADTPHLYVHTQLPGHYINLFLPAVSGGSIEADIKVGQTAFVLGSHQLRVSAHIMNEEGGQEALEERLVRPHLQAGDALLFDCRILHFGLANQYTNEQAAESNCNSNSGQSEVCTDGWRPLLYINYHQKFFQDPKNWNDKEKLF